MKQMLAKDIALAVAGELKADENLVITSISTDSRTIIPGCLYIAIRGQNFDGHDFVASAIENGAALVLVDEAYDRVDNLPCIRCSDTVKGLGDLAAWHRSRFAIPVIAVTGSIGKTSTREMIAAALSSRYIVHKTKGNYNNEIGLPLSVLELDDCHTAAVFELGMRGLGEIGYLSRIVKPDIAVITNIGLSHIEKLGSRQNILRAKLEIIEGMPATGIIVLNGEDELLKGLRGLLRFKTIYYGLDEATDIQGYEVFSMGEHGMSFKTSIAGADGTFTINAPGMHNVSNALSALAVCHVLGLTQQEAEEGFKRFSAEKMRLSISDVRGVKVINDSYNAAPASMLASLDVMGEIGANRRTIAVLGDMFELGDWTRESHLDVGRHVVTTKTNILIAIGENAKWYLSGAAELGMTDAHMKHFLTVADASDFLEALIEPNDVVLFKGSRGMKLDALVEKLFPAEAQGE